MVNQRERGPRVCQVPDRGCTPALASSSSKLMMSLLSHLQPFLSSMSIALAFSRIIALLSSSGIRYLLLRQFECWSSGVSCGKAMPLFSPDLFRPRPSAVGSRIPVPKAAVRPAMGRPPKAKAAVRPTSCARSRPRSSSAPKKAVAKPQSRPAPKAVARPPPRPAAPPSSDAPALQSEFRTFSLPAALRSRLDSWGLRLRDAVEKVRTEWLKSQGVLVFRRLGQHRVRLGTACSGAEAPVWSLRALQVPFEHVFACDTNPQVRKFIAANSPPTTKLFDDMLSRDLDTVPVVDVYVCGFPCTPYSSLRGHRTKLFKEVAAKPYFAVLKLLKHRRPPLAVLENVGGLRRVMAKVLRDLEKLKWYFVIWMMIDCEALGEPVSRPRCYFLLVRRDASISSDVNAMVEFCKRCLLETRSPVHEHVRTRMFPNDSSEVQSWLKKATSTPVRETQAGGKKWLKKHEAFRRENGVQGFRRCGLQAVRSARQREVFGMQTVARGRDITLDVSQSIDRAHARTTGVMPTITPRGVCVVGVLDRPVLPCEKLLLHGFPLHRMRVPQGVSDADLGTMGGNTMHLHSVGLALLMGISLLRDPLPTTLAMQCPDKVVPAEFVSVPAGTKSEPSDGKRRRLS